MRHPFASILSTIALAVPCSIELYITNWRNLYEIGISMVIGASIIFSIVSICLWGIVYLLSVPISIQLKREISYGWEIGIAAASFAFVLWSFICLGLCFWNHWGFKWFILSVYIIPIYRIFICLIQLFYIKILKQ